MPVIAANLSMLFVELPLADRFRAAARAGFSAVEVLFPYDLPSDDLRLELDTNGLEIALINTPAGDWEKGERGHAAIPGREVDFQTGLKRALAYADILKPQHIHIMSGNASGPSARQTLIRNLQAACALRPEQSFLIEPLNPFDMPGYFLNSFDQAIRILEAVNAPNLGLQFDIFHAHRMTGDVVGCWHRVKLFIRHIQFADHPGRHEPGSGEIDFAPILAAIATSGYAGFLSAEYKPTGETTAGLGWRQEFQELLS